MVGNAAWETLTGFKTDEYIGRDVGALVEGDQTNRYSTASFRYLRMRLVYSLFASCDIIHAVLDY